MDFAALYKPFPESCVDWQNRHGRWFASVSARHVMNRLDEVLGPPNWKHEFNHVQDGVTCTVYVRIESAEGTEWVGKSDGAGFRDMPNASDTEKAGYSDAFKRASVHWGVGRYLYEDGVPEFAGSCPPPRRNSADPQRHQPCQPAPADREPVALGRRTQEQPPAAAGGQGQRQFNDFSIPKAGTGAVFAWAKAQERVFDCRVVEGMERAGQDMGVGPNFKAWSQEAVNEICGRAVAMIKTLPTYQGQWNHVDVSAYQYQEPSTDDGRDIPF